MAPPTHQGGQAATFNTLNQILPSAQKVAPSIQRITRNIGPNSYNQRFQGSAQQRTQQIDYPQGFHAISDYNTYNMVPNSGYQGTQNYNTQTGQGQQGQQAASPNADELFNRITKMMQNQFGLKPKSQTFSYRRPYPEWYDIVALPPRYRVPDFTKFTRQDGTTTMEHVSRFLTQLGEASSKQAHMVRFFPLSLSGPAFTWFSSLPANSIDG